MYKRHNRREEKQNLISNKKKTKISQQKTNSNTKAPTAPSSPSNKKTKLGI